MKFSKKLAGAAAIGAVAVLTFGGTAANAALEPITVAPSPTVGAESFTVSGEGCVDANGTPGEYAINFYDSLDTSKTVPPTVYAGKADANGSWTATIPSPAESEEYLVAAKCDLYVGGITYATDWARISKAAGVQLSVAEAKHYQSVDVSGSGFTPKENVRVEFRQNGKVVETLDTVTANRVGELHGEISLGNVLAAGTYDVVFTGETSGAEYSAPLTITGGSASSDAPIAPDVVDNGAADPASAAPAANIDPASTGAKGSLATTGGENLAPLAIAGGVAALALGAGAVALGRRKARASA
ncbi:hypothetical protein [Leucobacter sp. NPDC077196]|uniref:hypothetical protein n=1 Tax=Leucobacter sp. NPDC077196 TaxID=3154959 RepID=UPI00342BE095